MKKSLSVLISIVLASVMLLSFTACKNDAKTSTDAPETSSSAVEVTYAEKLGKGKTKFTFTVTDPEGKQTSFIINTDKKTVGEALMENNLIEGEEGAYGLYVKTVNGITVDYDKDGKYWAFYVNGELSATGVDMTDITELANYEFRAE